MDMYVVKTLALTTIILVVIYIFIFRRRRINREKTWDSVAEYRERYVNRRQKSDGHTDYITRYNSSEDYRVKADQSGKEQETGRDSGTHGADRSENLPEADPQGNSPDTTVKNRQNIHRL